MTLDMAAVSRLIVEMSRDIAARNHGERLTLALSLLRERAKDVAQLNKRVQEGKFIGLAAGLVDELDSRRPLSQLLAEHSVVATDGSLIEPDRHGPAYYYLLNIGSVVLRYGAQPRAILASTPKLGYRPEEMFLSLGEREVPLEGGVLRVKRAVAETERLADVLLEEPADRTLIGLQDGTLVLWMPEARANEADFRKALLPPFLGALDRLRDRAIPIASYISRPRSGELVNTLRVALCPFPVVDCRANCPQRGHLHPAACDGIDGVGDRTLLEALPLREGERSALFFSRSRMMDHYGDHRVYFCYLNVRSEVGRIEVPEWVANDRALLDLVQATVFDQCRRGEGYPRALTEAHEKAVIGMAEREQCERLIEAAMMRTGVRSAPSEKQRSKQRRGV